MVLRLSHLVKTFSARIENFFTSSRLGTGVKYSVKDSPGITHELFQRLFSFSYEGCKYRHPLLPLPISHKFVLMEFSSPNIAKPLHAGHLRSTVIGNVLSNLYAAAGHSVVRVNYIGDCGTQFAIIGTSLSDSDIAKLLKAEKAESRDVVLWLLQKYIEQSTKLYGEDSAADEPTISTGRKKVEQWNSQLESEDVHTKAVWQSIRDHSLQDLTNMYHRLGIRFDAVEYESDYISKAQELAGQLAKDSHQLQGVNVHNPHDSKGCLVSFKDSKRDVPVDDRPKVFLRSDGSTVYLSRDVAALLARLEKSKRNLGRQFDHVHYIVENGQHDHLESVRKMVCAIKPEHHEVLLPGMFHVKFGRIHGMSTRKGSAVLLSDILDEAHTRMLTILKEKPTTKIDKNDKSAMNEVSEKLAVTAVVVNDLKRRRQGDYKFNWDVALDFGSDGGIALQYAHARLCSIEGQAGFIVVNDLSVGLQQLLSVQSACSLIQHMLKFEDAVNDCLESLEPGPFVRYSLKLAKLANQCIEDPKLVVKGQDPDDAQPRLVLFKSTRNLLASCLNILGLPALSRI